MMNKVVIFDFDGVIANTFKMCYGINTEAEPGLTEIQYRSRFQGNINKATNNANSFSKEEFYERYGKKILHAALFDGIRESLETLNGKYIIVIVSSSNTASILDFLHHYNLKQYVHEVLGNDIHESKVEKFKMVFETYNASAESCVLITDTCGDVREAQEVNMPAIAVTWGYQDNNILKKCEPTAIITTPKEIIDQVSRILA